MATVQTGIATDLITFSRASNATLTDSDGRIKWAPHNLLLASEQFDNANWTKGQLLAFGSGSVANATSAPNGTTTADLLVPNTTSTQHTVAQTVTTETGISVVAGLFVKAGGYSKVALFDNAAGNRWASFSLSGSGSVLATAPSATGIITALSNGWYFISITEATGASAMAYTVYVLDDAYTTASPLSYSYAGNGTSGVYLSGAHLYRSDLGGMKANTSAYPMYNPTTPKNLLGFSEAFDNAAWSKTASTVSADSLSAPNGLVTSDTLTASAGTVFPQVLQSTSVYATPQMVSVYAKAGTYGILQMFNAYGAAHYANFNLSAGVVGTKGASVSDSGMVALGNGWYRCWAYFTALDDVGIGMAGSTSATKQAAWTTAGTETIYLYGAQLSDSASLDTYVPNNGAAPTAAAYYGPRLDADPVTLSQRGLLVEESRTNLLLRSEEFDNAYWGAFGVKTVTANQIASPSGLVTADLLGNPGSSAIQTSVTISASTTYTFSVYAKAGTGPNIRLSYVTTGGVGTNGFVDRAISAGTDVGGGWYRHTMSFTSVASDNSAVVRIHTGPSDPTPGIYIWGAQLEAGSFATSYIPTGAATATRNADVASVSTSQFPYSATEGTLVISADSYDVGSSAGLIASLSAGLTSNSVLVGLYLNKTSLSATAGGVAQAFLQPSGTVSANTVFKAGGAFATNSFIASSNGTLSTEDTSGSLPTGVTTLGIGIISSSIPINGHIRQITYLPRRISNAELITRTS